MYTGTPKNSPPFKLPFKTRTLYTFPLTQKGKVYFPYVFSNALFKKKEQPKKF